MYEYSAIITRIIDGDTFEVDVDCGFCMHAHVKVRIINIDTPESRGQEKELGKIVSKYAERWLGSQVILRTYKQDSFGRWLGDIIIMGTSLADIYTTLGVNKNSNNYSEAKVRALL